MLTKFETFNKFLFFLLIVTFFFQQPEWCLRRNKGKDKPVMSGDCNFNLITGEKYFLSALVKLPPIVADSITAVSWGCMLFLIIGDVLIVLFIGKFTYKLRVLAMISCLALDVLFAIANWMEIGGIIFQYNLSPFFKIAFMILYNTSMRNAMLRFLHTMKEAFEAILVYLLNLLIWSGFAFILFSGI